MMTVFKDTKSTASFSFVKISCITAISVLFPLVPPIIAGFLWILSQN